VDESARQEVIVAWPVDECRRLLEAEGANLHLRKGESGLAQLGFASLCGTIIQDSVSVCSDTAVRGSSSDRTPHSTNAPTAYGAVWTIAAWKVWPLR
jgi:hypothetical protein